MESEQSIMAGHYILYSSYNAGGTFVRYNYVITCAAEAGASHLCSISLLLRILTPSEVTISVTLAKAYQALPCSRSSWLFQLYKSGKSVSRSGNVLARSRCGLQGLLYSCVILSMSSRNSVLLPQLITVTGQP